MNHSIIKNIINYSVTNTNLFYENIKKDFFSNGELILSNIFGHSTYNNNTVVLIKNENSVLESILISINKKINFTFGINPIYFSKDFIFVKNEISENRKKYSYFLFDLNINQIKFHSNNYYGLAYPYIFKENLFFANENLIIISNLHLPTETTLWQFSVAELGAEKVSKILGVFGQVLVVVCAYIKELRDENGRRSSGNFEKIIGLNVSTGKLLYEVNEYELDGEVKLFGSAHSSYFTFNEGETTMHALMGFYISFDTQSGQTKAQNVDGQAYELGINSLKSSSIDGHYLGFRAARYKVGGFDSVVGIFNIETLLIEDHYTNFNANKDDAFFRPGQPKIHGNKLYALDTSKTLHILEREDV